MQLFKTNILGTKLVPRKDTITVSKTNGVWVLNNQTSLFESFLDPRFGDIDGRPTPKTKAVVCDHRGTERLFKRLIPNDPRFFFKGPIQALQVIHENHFLTNEIIMAKKRVYVLFMDADGNPYPACISSNFSWLNANLGDYHRGAIPQKKQGIIVLPETAFS